MPSQADTAKMLVVAWDTKKTAFATKAATKPVTAPANGEPEAEEAPSS